MWLIEWRPLNTLYLHINDSSEKQNTWRKHFNQVPQHTSSHHLMMQPGGLRKGQGPSTHFQGSYRSVSAGFIWFWHPSLHSYITGGIEAGVRLHETKALASKRSRKNSHCSFVKEKWWTSGNLRPLPSVLPSPAHSQHTPSKRKHTRCQP